MIMLLTIDSYNSNSRLVSGYEYEAAFDDHGRLIALKDWTGERVKFAELESEDWHALMAAAVKRLHLQVNELVADSTKEAVRVGEFFDTLTEAIEGFVQ